MDADEKIRLIDELFRGFASRDNARAFEVFDDEVVFDTRAFPGPDSLRGVFHGHDGVRAWWRQWLDAWESVGTIDGPHHLVNGNQVISCWTQLNRGKASGVELEMEVGNVWTFQGDKIVRTAVFGSHSEARAAAGLER